MNPLEQYIYRESDWPHGLRCGRCDAAFSEGGVYATVTLSPATGEGVGGAAIEEIVCLDCGLTP